MLFIKPFIKVPVVLFENLFFTIFPNTREIIERVIFNPYSFDKNYFRYSLGQLCSFEKSISPRNIKNKNILELGPGTSIGFGLLALQSGAKKYIAIDDGDHAPSTPRIKYIYQEQFFEGDKTLFSHYFTSDGHFNSQKIHFINNDQVSPYPLPNNSIDFIYSCAVLEHVHDLDLCFQQMTRVLRPGGIMNHQIDFRDHIFYQNSLWFLSLSETLFKTLFSKTGEYTNRKRLSYYQQLFETNNLRTLSLETNLRYEGTLDKKLLKNYSESDLRTLSINVTLEKQ